MSSAIRAGAAFVELGIRNKMERGLNAASKRLKSFAAGVSGAGMAAAGVGLKIAAPFALAAGVFGQFDQRMAAVKAITNATDDQMARLRDTAKTLGASTQFSASEAAEAMKFLGMAGYNTEQILAGIPAVLDLAAAGAIDLGMAADIASDVSSAFGLAADDIGRVADVLASTATSSNTSIEMMGETFKYLAPLAAAAGQTIEEAAAATGIIANSGVKASMAGTDLALMMKTLANPAAQKQLKALGVETIDAAGNVRDFSDIMRDLSAATANMSEAEKLSFFETVFSRAAKSALILTQNTQGLDDLNNKLQNSEGAAKRMAATMSDSLLGDFTVLLSSLEGVGIAVGEALAKPVRAFLTQIAAVLSAITEWVNNNQGLVVTIASIGAALIAAGALLLSIAAPLAILGAMFGGLATLASVAAGAIGAVGSVIGALLSPVGLVIAGIVAAAGAVLYFSGAGTAAIQFLRDAFASLAAEVSHVASGILAALNTGDLETIGKILSQSLVLYWKMAIGEMQKAWISFSTRVVNVLDSTFSGILDGSLINSLAMRMGLAVANIMDAAIKTFTSTFASLLSYLGVSLKAFEKQSISAALEFMAATSGTSESRGQARSEAAAARIAEIDAEIEALRAARDATIDGAVDAAAAAAAEAADKAATDATTKTQQRAAASASAAGDTLRGSAITSGTFSAVAAERSFRSGGGVADAFRTVAKDIVGAVNGTTDAVNNLQPMAFE